MFFFSPYAIRIFLDTSDNNRDTRRRGSPSLVKTMSFAVTCSPLDAFDQMNHPERRTEEEGKQYDTPQLSHYEITPILFNIFTIKHDKKTM